MKNIFSLSVLILALITAIGCAGAGKSRTSYHLLNEEEQRIAYQVKRANTLFNEGEYATASKIYSQLLEEHSSEDGSFETALRTNLCLAYLELGERQGFKDCALKLKDSSKDLPYLSRETQMVLELNRTLEGGDRAGKDLRIETRITDGLSEVFNGEVR